MINVGLIHSVTGTMAFSESPLIDAARLAVKEINETGGVNGQKLN